MTFIENIKYVDSLEKLLENIKKCEFEEKASSFLSMGLNIYITPVMMTDPSGEFPLLFTIALIAGLVIGGTAGGVYAAKHDINIASGILMGAGLGLMLASMTIATGGAALVKAGVVTGITFAKSVAIGFAANAIGAVILQVGAGIDGKIVNIESSVNPLLGNFRQHKKVNFLNQYQTSFNEVKQFYVV